MSAALDAVLVRVRAVVDWFAVEENRGDAYRLIVLLSPVLVTVGVFTDAQAAQVVGYAGAILGTTLAAGNTRSKRVGPGPRKRNR